MGKIILKHLSFGFDEQIKLLFEDLNLNIDTAWKLGLVGRNGRGKTTFLKLLQGKYNYRGNIETDTSFSYFPVSNFDATKSVFEIIANYKNIELWQVEKELGLLNLDNEILERLFAELSGGEQTKVLLALAFSDQTKFSLIDEPTNHLDLASRNIVANYLKNKKSGFIVVSHDRHFLNSITDHTLAIENNQAILYRGNFATYEFEKANRDQAEIEKNAHLKREITSLKASAIEKAKWSNKKEKEKYGSKYKKRSRVTEDKGAIGHKAAKLMKRSKNIQNRLESQISAKKKLLKNIEDVDRLIMNPISSHHKNFIIAKDFYLSYDDRPLFKPTSFQLNQGDILGIIGPNGVGKTSLLKYLQHNFSGTSSGQFEINPAISFSYLKQNFDNQRGSLKQFSAENSVDFEMLLNNLRKLGIDRKVFNTKIENLSLGQQKRVALATSLITPANLYLFDEPLNYLDVFNQDQIKEMILNYHPTMIIIDHDIDFLESIATTIIELKKSE